MWGWASRSRPITPKILPGLYWLRGRPKMCWYNSFLGAAHVNSLALTRSLARTIMGVGPTRSGKNWSFSLAPSYLNFQRSEVAMHRDRGRSPGLTFVREVVSMNPRATRGLALVWCGPFQKVDEQGKDMCGPWHHTHTHGRWVRSGTHGLARILDRYVHGEVKGAANLEFENLDCNINHPTIIDFVTIADSGELFV